MDNNVHDKTIHGFGSEWTRFSQSELNACEASILFSSYFSLVPLNEINKDSFVADFGAGSGRWAKIVAPMVKKLICIEPSEAVEVCKRNLSDFQNVDVRHETIQNCSIQDNSLDFAYSLGVLHHIPDTEKALRDCVKKLKIGSPILIYLYYRFDNRPKWFIFIWFVTNILRQIISRLPERLKFIVCDLIAVSIYFPMAKIAFLLNKVGIKVENLPLAFYRDSTFYTMRTDALDRFGTRLEHRFTKDEVIQMMKECGLGNIAVSNSTPFWCALGYRQN